MIPKLVVEITTTRFFPLVVKITTRVVVKITTRVVVKITTRLVVKITTHSYIVTLSYMVKDAGMRASLSTLQPNAHCIVTRKAARYCNANPESIAAGDVDTDNPSLSQAKPALLRRAACIGVSRHAHTRNRPSIANNVVSSAYGAGLGEMSSPLQPALRRSSQGSDPGPNSPDG